MKNDFHIKGWAPTLVLKQRPGGTRKWSIVGPTSEYTIVIDQSTCKSRVCHVVMDTRNASRIESDHNFALSDQTSDLAVDCLFKKEKLFAALSLYYNLHCNITLLLGIFLDISEPFWDMQRKKRNWLFITNLEKLKFDEIYSKYRNESSFILIFLRVLKGAVSRQSSSFCLILPITRPQSLWNLK